MRAIDADMLKRYMGLEEAVKYGNKTEEQQHKSYETYMRYEIADCIDDMPTIETTQNWISVKDRLPDDLRFVLAYIRHKKTPYDQYRDIRIMLRLEKYGWLHLEERSEVTHWMPLPKPPKDASDASDS